MNKIFLILLFILQVNFVHGRLVDGLDSLSYEDQEIYLTTFHKCRSLSQYGAWWVGIDTDIALGNFVNLTNITLNFDGKLLNQRIQHGLKSPQLHKKINSKGYHLALSHCFRSSQKNSFSNFSYQSVLVSLYVTEIATTAGFAIGVVKGAPLLAQFMLNHKIAAALLIMTQATVQEVTSEISTGKQLIKSLEEIKAHRSSELSTIASDEIFRVRRKLIEIKEKQLVAARNQLERTIMNPSEEAQLRKEYETLEFEIQELKVLRIGLHLDQN